LKKVIAEIEQIYNKEIGIGAIKKLIKESGYIWKRIRKSFRSKRDEEKFRKCEKELEEWKKIAKRGEIELYYFDESGFSLNPTVSYAWQKRGTTIEVPMAKSVQLNVLGFLSIENKLESFIFSNSISSDVVVECFNIFANSLQKKTLVVLDNAPIHTSEEFDEWIDTWEQKGLFLYYLPTYSPELNLIENLWRFIKYHWLPFSAYLSISSLYSSLQFILANFGSLYRISFN